VVLPSPSILRQQDAVFTPYPSAGAGMRARKHPEDAHAQTHAYTFLYVLIQFIRQTFAQCACIMHMNGLCMHELHLACAGAGRDGAAHARVNY